MKYSNGYSYFSKKFLGIVIAFDCNVPQSSYKNPIVLMIEIKFLFAGFWVEFTKH